MQCRGGRAGKRTNERVIRSGRGREGGGGGGGRSEVVEGGEYLYK